MMETVNMASELVTVVRSREVDKQKRFVKVVRPVEDSFSLKEDILDDFNDVYDKDILDTVENIFNTCKVPFENTCDKCDTENVDNVKNADDKEHLDCFEDTHVKEKLDYIRNTNYEDSVDKFGYSYDTYEKENLETVQNIDRYVKKKLNTGENIFDEDNLGSGENIFDEENLDTGDIIFDEDNLDTYGNTIDEDNLNTFENIFEKGKLDSVDDTNTSQDAHSLDKTILCYSTEKSDSCQVFCVRCGSVCTTIQSKYKDISRTIQPSRHYHESRDELHEAGQKWRSARRRLGSYKKYAAFPMSLPNIIILLALPTLLHAMGNDILRLNIPTEPQLDPSTVCKTYPDLNAPQYHLCFQFPDVTASAIQGVQIAIHECQFQLRNHRWNCSTLEKKNKNPHSSPILRRGYRETAFAYAISAAGVTHQVSKACSMGKLRSCGCDVSVHGKTKDWEWGGCSHNLEFGEKFAEKFMDLKEKAHDIHARINLHNNKVGRMAVIENVRTKCKCHGMSGSCELKTCWKATPDFREIGELLKTKFNMANKQVDLSNEASRGPPVDHRETVFPTTLLYYEKSPNFCHKDPEYDSPGTIGRLCNKSTDGLDNCETLCCGRGYNTLKVRRTERCHCKFHWCCYVICQTCTYNEWVTVCK